MGKILICVDCQYDFIEGGSLPVDGARKAMKKLEKLLLNNAQDYDAVICTLDWHPHGHCSFVPEGGLWPVHCVQHTHGAALYQPIVEALPKNKMKIFLKGYSQSKDEYSFLDNKENKKVFNDIVKELKPEAIELCGIAGDVCVMNTAKGLIDMGLQEKVVLRLQSIASLDDEVTRKFISDNSLRYLD